VAAAFSGSLLSGGRSAQHDYCKLSGETFPLFTPDVDAFFHIGSDPSMAAEPAPGS
jgi:hypothetical protein